MSILDPVILSQLQLLAKSMAETLAALGTSVTGVKTDVGTVSGQVNAVSNALATLQATANTINNTANVINAKNTGIKSVQRGVITYKGTSSAAVTISAVNVAKSELRFLGGSNNGAWPGGRIELTNATTVSIVSTINLSAPAMVGWELTEWN